MALAKSGCGLLPAECTVRQRRTSALLALPKGEVFCRTQSAGDYQFRAFAEKKNICGNPLRSQNRPCAAPHGPVRVDCGSYPAWPLKSPHGADTGETAGGCRFSGTRRIRTQGRKPRSFALLLHTRYMQTPCLWHKIEERTISAFALLRPSTYQHPFPMTALLS